MRKKKCGNCIYDFMSCLAFENLVVDKLLGQSQPGVVYCFGKKDINPDNNCKYYLRKWWKFWVTK